MESKDTERIEKIFPDYFKRFTLPEGAREERLRVYRACRTGKCDKDSFLSTFEQNRFTIPPLSDPADPGQYSLSTYEKPTHIKRYADLTSDLQIPYKIAVGITEPRHGLIQRTRERIKKKKGSHVDWWLYKDAAPYNEFELIPDFEKHLQEYIRERDKEK